MTRPLEAMLTRLAAAGCGVKAVTLFGGPVADLPPLGFGAFLTVSETGGRGALGTQQEPSALRQPWFQIAAHADRYEDAAALCDQAYAGTSGSNVEVDDVFFLTLRAVQEPAGIGTDAQGRPLVAFNVATLLRGNGPPPPSWIQSGWTQ